MIRKLAAAAALVFAFGVAASTPAPAIDFRCSCTLCTSPTQGLACRDHTGRFTSCGQFYLSRCAP